MPLSRRLACGQRFQKRGKRSSIRSPQSATGTGGVSIDNLTMTSGTLNLNLTTAAVNIKGNITVNSGATLGFKVPDDIDLIAPPASAEQEKTAS